MPEFRGLARARIGEGFKAMNLRSLTRMLREVYASPRRSRQLCGSRGGLGGDCAASIVGMTTRRGDWHCCVVRNDDRAKNIVAKLITEEALLHSRGTKNA